MATLTIPYDDDLLLAAGKSPAELEQELRVFLAAKLFESARISLGRAARMAGLPKAVFMEELGRLQISWINLDEDELRRGRSAGECWSKREKCSKAAKHERRRYEGRG